MSDRSWCDEQKNTGPHRRDHRIDLPTRRARWYPRDGTIQAYQRRLRRYSSSRWESAEMSPHEGFLVRQRRRTIRLVLGASSR